MLPDSLIEQQKQLIKTRSNLQGQIVAQIDDKQHRALTQQLNQTEIALNKLKGDIKQKYPKYASMQSFSPSITTSGIQQQLQKDEAVLQYFIGDSITYIGYVDQTQIKVHQFSIKKKELQKRIHNFHNNCVCIQNN